MIIATRQDRALLGAALQLAHPTSKYRVGHTLISLSGYFGSGSPCLNLLRATLLQGLCTLMTRCRATGHTCHHRTLRLYTDRPRGALALAAFVADGTSPALAVRAARPARCSHV